MKNEIRIEVSSTAGTGKSTIAYAIAKMLAEDFGIYARWNNNEHIAIWEEDQDKRVSSLKEKKPIVKIVEKQVCNGAMSSNEEITMICKYCQHSFKICKNPVAITCIKCGQTMWNNNSPYLDSKGWM